MALEILYDTKEEVPEAHTELYTEVEGKWALTGINGLVTKADVDKLNVALGKERTDHKATKAKVAVWADVDKEKNDADLVELTELRAAAEAGEGGKDAKEKFEKGVNAAAEARISAAKIASDRVITDLEKVGTEQAEKIVGFEKADTVRNIGDDVRKATTAAKVIDTAVEDVLMYAERVFEINDEGLVLTRDNVGVTPGIAPEIWLAEMQDKRPHWWPVSQGGGAGGGSGGQGFPNNPWTREHWNLTDQGKAIRADKAKAERMATAAGTAIGGKIPGAAKKA